MLFGKPFYAIYKITISHVCSQIRIKDVNIRTWGHGPHSSPQKQFQSTNTFAHDIIIPYFLLRSKKNHYLLFEDWLVLICLKLNPLHPRMLCAQFGWNWPSRKEDFKFRYVFSLFCLLSRNISLCIRTRSFNWKKLNPLHLRTLCAKFCWNWPRGLGE